MLVRYFEGEECQIVEKYTCDKLVQTFVKLHLQYSVITKQHIYQSFNKMPFEKNNRFDTS